MIGRLMAATDLGVKELTDPRLWGTLSGGRRTSAGIAVTADISNTLSVYFACKRVLAEDVAKLPVFVVRELQPRGREVIRGHTAARLIGARPNPEMKGQEFVECLTERAADWGGGFAEVVRDGGGTPVELWPIHPSRCKPARNDAGHKVWLVRVDDPIGRKVGAEQVMIPDEDMFHIQGLSKDGYSGYSVLDLAAESIGAGIAVQRFGSSFFANGAGIGGALVTPSKLSPEAATNMRKTWNEMHAGAENANKIAFFGEGMKFEKMGIPPENAQFLETRQFSVVDICRWFRMAPHKVQDLTNAHFTNIEHSGIEHVTDTLMPWLLRWEHEVARVFKLADDEKFKFNANALMRGDSQGRAIYYEKMSDKMMLNEIRELEDLNPVPGGDVILVNANNKAPLDKVVSGEAGASSGSAGSTSSPPRTPARDEPDAKLAFMPAFADACNRLMSRMGISAKRAVVAKSHAEWASAFAPKHMTVALEALGPLAESMAKVMGADPQEAAQSAADFILSDTAAAVAELRDAWQPDAAGMVADQWLVERPAKMAVELTDLIGDRS